MKAIGEISAILRASAQRLKIRQSDLKTQAGISQRTLTNVLSGTADFKVSTLLSLADRLGLELALVPKAAATAVEAGPTAAPRIKSRVAAALERVEGTRTAAGARVDPGVRQAAGSVGTPALRKK
ncbi:helix-turn-helix domain-containing protein [Roseateles sp. DC23W]|uniref:Helix-turn-helix domain-containing protein n=1 Tax=Pelomonas dachongensis TaxID=3299029 RepID=A0ABW7ETM2_9BURK